MKRLIYADNLMEQVKEIHKAVDTVDINQDYDTGFHSAISQIQGLIAYMPTIDPVHAAHAVYCGECKYANNKYGQKNRVAKCENPDAPANHRIVFSRDFCRYGERKE